MASVFKLEEQREEVLPKVTLARSAIMSKPFVLGSYEYQVFEDLVGHHLPPPPGAAKDARKKWRGWTVRPVSVMILTGRSMATVKAYRGKPITAWPSWEPSGLTPRDIDVVSELVSEWEKVTGKRVRPRCSADVGGLFPGGINPQAASTSAAATPATPATSATSPPTPAPTPAATATPATEELIQLRSAVDVHKARATRLQGNIDTLLATVQDLRDSRAAVTAELRSELERNARAAAEAKDVELELLRGQLRDKTQLADKYHEDLGKVRKDKDSLEAVAEVRELRAERDGANTKMEKVVEERREAERQLAKVEGVCEQLKAQLDALRKVEADKVKTEDRLKRAANDLQRIRAERDDLKEILASASELAEKREKSLTDLDAELKRLKKVEKTALPLHRILEVNPGLSLPLGVVIHRRLGDFDLAQLGNGHDVNRFVTALDQHSGFTIDGVQVSLCYNYKQPYELAQFVGLVASLIADKEKIKPKNEKKLREGIAKYHASKK